MEQTLINDNKIYWVYGNTQALIIPLEQEIIRDGEEGRTEPYYPDAEAEVIVSLVSRFKSYNYTPVVNGNLLTIADDGTLPVGCYSVRVVVNNPDGTQLRSLWENQVVVTNDNVRTLQEWNEFKDQNPQARAAVFFFAKGDPFTYEDFTQEEIEELQKPARDAAAEITEDYNTNIKEDYTNNVKGDYNTNVKEDYAVVKQNAQQATSDANDAATNANQKAGVANNAAQNAEDKGTYAKNQGDYAKQKAGEIEDAKGDYQNLDARLDAMEADTDDRMERLTEEEFNAIFD